MHVDRVQVTGVHRAGDLQLGGHTDVHPAQLLPGDGGHRRLPRNLQTERHHVHRAGLHLEGTAQTNPDELDVLLLLLVAALHLDPCLQADGETLDLLVDTAALDTHLALDDTARDHVLLGEHRLHGGPTGTQAREQLLESHDLHSFSVLTPTYARRP